jgi:hypothetical protein
VGFHSSLIAVGHNTLPSIHHSPALALCNRDIRIRLLSLGVPLRTHLTYPSFLLAFSCFPFFESPTSASEKLFCSWLWHVNWQRITTLHHMSKLFSCPRSAVHQLSRPNIIPSCLYVPPVSFVILLHPLPSPSAHSPRTSCTSIQSSDPLPLDP